MLTILLALIERLIPEIDPAPRLAACRKVLMVDPAAIGDMVMSTPAYRAVKERIPGVRIEAMAFDIGKAVFRNNPNVDAVHVIPRTSFLGQLRTALRLRRERYDAVINLYTGLRMNFWCLVIGAPLRVGYDYRHRGCFHNVRVPIATRTVQTIYRPEECLQLLERAFGWTIAERGMLFSVSDEDHKVADRVLTGLGCGPDDTLVGLHTNCVSRRELKLWDPAKFAELADRLIARYGVKVVFTGAPDDRDHVEGIIGRVQRRDRTVNATGTVTLSGLGAMLQRFALFVTLDTGPLHVSIAVGTPTVAMVGGVPFDIVIPPSNPKVVGLTVAPAAVRGMEPVWRLPVNEVDAAVETLQSRLNLFVVHGLGPTR